MSADTLFFNMIGRSLAHLGVIDTIKRVADRDVVVSIYGETGTGKELVARSLHYMGRRGSGPFIPVNCGALPDNLFESELFGHRKGAFTDAREDHPGLIEQADSGTLFLDEIEALSPKGQVALLRFLQDGQYRRLGGKRTRQANVRILAASNVPLEVLRDHPGRFREDLFYRLNIVPVHLPPLRERTDDILALAHHFLAIFKARFDTPDRYLGADSLEWLLHRNWPGNIRELENTVQRGVLLAPGAEIRPEHLCPPSASVDSQPGATFDGLHRMVFKEAKACAMAQFERAYLNATLSRTTGNVTLAAQNANKERRAFGKLLKKHNINPADFRNL